MERQETLQLGYGTSHFASYGDSSLPHCVKADDGPVLNFPAKQYSSLSCHQHTPLAEKRAILTAYMDHLDKGQKELSYYKTVCDQWPGDYPLTL